MDIFEAINNKDIAKIKELLNKGVDPTTSRSDGLKVLHVAAIKNDPEILEILLKQHNVQCDIVDNDGNTPLHFAAQQSCVDSVSTLLAFGASPVITNKIGKKPIDLTTDDGIRNVLSEILDESRNGKSLQQARIDFLKQMEAQLPNDVTVLKSFAIEFILASQLFQERCKETIYELVREKHETMYKQQALENQAGIIDKETGVTFLENLQKIEEENELKAATIARLKIQNHMLEQNAQAKTESYRRTMSDMIDQQAGQVKIVLDSLLEKETAFTNEMSILSEKIISLRQENGELITQALATKSSTMKTDDLVFLQTMQNENYALQKSIFDTQSECTILGERLKSMETLRGMHEKDINKIRIDAQNIKKAIQETMTKAFTEARTEADDKDEESGQVLFAKGENGKKQVKAAMLEKLLDRLIDPSTYDSQFQTTFLLTFRSFTDTHTVLNFMMKRYKDSMVTNTSNPSSQSASSPARQRICQTIKDWIELYSFDFEEDKTLYAKVMEFVDYIYRHNTKNANLIKSAINKKGTKDDVISDKTKDPPPKPILPRALAKRVSNAAEADEAMAAAHARQDRAASMTTWSGFNFGKSRTLDGRFADDGYDVRLGDLDPLEIARQITLIEYQLFTVIKPTEFMDQAWLKEDKEQKAPNICEMTKWSYHVTQWVISEIVTVKDLKSRAAVLEKFINVAQCLEQMNNFNGVKEVLNALQAQVIRGLIKTKEGVTAKSLKTFDGLEKIISSEMNYKLLRAKIHKAALPLLPYPGIYQTDLSLIDTGSKNVLDNRMINFSKYMRLASYITELKVYQQTPYNFESVHEIAEYVRSYDVLTEAEATKFANSIEPK